MANELRDLAKAIARAEPDGTVLHQRISAVDRDVAGLLPGSAVGSAARMNPIDPNHREGQCPHCGHPWVWESPDGCPVEHPSGVAKESANIEEVDDE